MDKSFTEEDTKFSFTVEPEQDEEEQETFETTVSEGSKFSFTVEPEQDDEGDEVIDYESQLNDPLPNSSETDEALTPAKVEDVPSEKFEIDPRIASKYAELTSDVSTEVEKRLADNQAEQRNYQMQVDLAKKEDELTGGNRAAMIPKPQSQEFTERSIEALKEKKLDLRNSIQSLLQDPNPIRRTAVDSLLNTDLTLEHVNYIVRGADFAPVTGALLGVTDIPQNVSDARSLWHEGKYGSALGLIGLSTAELAFAAVGTKAVLSPVASKVKSSLPVTKTMNEIKDADEAATLAKKENAAQVAKLNTKIGQSLIEEFEESTGKIISNVNNTGVKTLDGLKARAAGLEIAQEISDLQDARAVAFVKDPKKAREDFKQTAVGNLTEEVSVQDLTDDVENLVNPLLNPEKFNAIVAIASDFQKANPKAFPKDKPIIDSLFEYTVSKDLTDSEELATLLSKYGLTFDDYVLTIVGSGSEAGKILNKLSQIRRAGSLETLERKKMRAKDLSQNKLMAAWRRIDNARRGGMVSMIKTASRNLTSATIRSPLEALENVLDTTLYNMSDEWAMRQDVGKLRAFVNASSKGLTSTISPKNWRDSTKALQRTYANPILAKEVTDFVLKRPEFDEQYTAMFDLVNEYQTNLGKGQAKTKAGKAVDATISTLEDTVYFLNTPNRIQEFIIRRGAFMGELERLVSREYKKDLMQVLKEGKLQDLIANSNTVRPKGARPFEEIIEDSVRRALDVTYAKAPDIKLFNDTANFITRNGLTAFTTPFPRFMFNSIELIGQYSAGAFNPAIKRAFGKKTGPLDRKDRQNISRNLSGLVGITAAYMYRKSEGAPEDYKLLNTEEGNVMDTTSQYPLRQALWFGEAIDRLSPSLAKKIPLVRGVKGLSKVAGLEDTESDGTFNDWFDLKDAQEVFLGTAARTGVGNIYVAEISKILAGGEDITGTERFQRVAARQIVDYLRTWAIPITQITELQRATGYRPSTYADAASDQQTLDITFSERLGQELERTGKQTGLSNIFNPSEEYQMPTRVSIFSDAKERKGLGLSLLGGITQFTKNSPEAEYLENLGYSEWDLSSKEREPSIRKTENQFFLEVLPNIVDELKALETGWRKEYMQASPNSVIRKNKTLQQYINTEAKFELDRQRKAYKQRDRKYITMNTDTLVLNNRKFRKLNPKIRKLVVQRFMLEEDRKPDFSSVEDLDWLLTEGSLVKK